MEEPGAARARGCGFAVWLHGLGDCGRANEFVADHFSAAAFTNTRWAFPTAPTSPVTCNRGMLMPSWFDIHDAPITSKSVRDEEDVLRAVQSVHTMIDREIAAGTNPGDVFVFGLSQGGALSITSVLLYPKTLGGCAVFSGFLPFGSSFADRVTAEAKKTPVLWIHGGADSLVPIEAGRDGVKFLRGLGMTCEFKVYERLGHTLAPYELEYCERWAADDILNEHGKGLKRGGPSKTVRDEKEVLRAVEQVHELLDKEIAAGTSPSNIFVCGMSQGGALAIASALLYPKTLGGCVVFSGSVPLSKSFAEKVSSEARKTPVLWFHGMADGLVLFEAGHAGCAFLEELGMTFEFKMKSSSIFNNGSRIV
ncbi:probable inactive carboxylesterase Os04g0669700 isoform X2 [Phragmites australis]|uniref:probable inactive carboxylesterase Os04g0669700 isoform X2 n=1 Tax=Phragmites australis TaxID=29695 RepID=UPI002D79C4B4|nr:probable inactive carboxylesterase Os04g0669700 isoform X2 [Phragmites australis]